MLLTIGISPQAAVARDITISGATCTADGLADAINTASDGSTVTFDCDDPLITFAEGDTITITSTTNVTIDGSNAGRSQIVLNGGDVSSFFYVESGASLTLRHLTMEHGAGSEVAGVWAWRGGAIINLGTATIIQCSFNDNYATAGGAIDNHGTITVSRSTFTTNTSSSGGALFNDTGTMTIDQSRFDSNSTVLYGGAIYNFQYATTTITRSSFVNNSAILGGAILAEGTVKVTASTFTGNISNRDGSTIFVDQNLNDGEIAWSTIVQPQGEDDPAIWFEGDLTLTGVILAGYGDHCAMGGQFTPGTLTDSYTLANDASCGLTTANNSQENVADLVGSASTIILNGVAQTYFPLPTTSPARNAGPSTCDTAIDEDTVADLDQLGNPRPISTNCDIGAIEADNIPPIFTSFGGSPSTINEGETVTIAATAFDLEPNTLSYAVDCDTSDSTFPIFTPDSSQICDYPDNGTFSGKYIVSDGTATNSQLFTIVVLNLDPEITAVNVSPSLVSVNQPVNINLTATDVPADALSLNYTCGSTPSSIASPVTSDSGTFNLIASCTFTSPGNFTITGTVMDDDGGESDPFTFQSVQVVSPTTLCANQWNGTLRQTNDCGRGETQIILPMEGPITICVNQWNGATRLGPNCSRSEHQITATGNNSIPTCVNRWSHALRIADRCTRSERADQL